MAPDGGGLEAGRPERRGVRAVSVQLLLFGVMFWAMLLPSASADMLLDIPDTHHLKSVQQCFSCTKTSQCPLGIECGPCVIGARTCELCTPGKASRGGENSCATCAAGKASGYGHGLCDGCPRGRFSAAESAFCTACSPGKFADMEETASCKPCTTAHRSGASTCESNQQIASQLLGTSSVKNVRSSPTSFETSLRNLENCAACKSGPECPPGLGCFPATCFRGDRTCQMCSKGYASAKGSATCMACPAGKASSQGSSACATCSAGQFSASKASGSCTHCSVGRFADSTGSIRCKACSSALVVGATSCSRAVVTSADL